MKNEQNTALRFGHVKEYDAGKHMAKVTFPDMGIVSGWMPILVPNSLRNHDELHLDAGEHVACLCAGTGTECGVILGAFYDNSNKPPVKDQDIRSVTFDDGTTITYDRKEHVMTLSGAQAVTLAADNITLSGQRITFSGGHIDLDGSVTCPGYCRC